MHVADFPFEKIEIACPRCGRRGVYRRARFSDGLRLPDLLAELTQDCPRTGTLVMLDRCKAHFPQLAKAV